MNLPDDLKYTEEHEWVRTEGDVLTLGVTDHAQEALGDIVFFEAPVVGTNVDKGEAFCVVESVKTVGDIYSPVSGEIVSSNGALDDAPETINSDPYGEGWLVQIKVSDTADLSSLMDASAYEAFLATVE